MTEAIDLTKEQRKTLLALLRRFIPGVAVWAYGSRVKWASRPNSDLDLVAFATPAQGSQVSDLKEALAESSLPFPVDLHVWDEVPERFREIIRKGYVVLQEAKQPGSGSGGLGIAGESPIEHDLRWPVVSLAEIAVKIGSGATPKGGADAYLPSRARFALVRSQNVFDRRFDYDGLAFISDEQADGLRGVILQPDDILLNITGDGITFGRACMVPKDVLPACVNQHVSIIRLDPQRADPGYVLAFLTHPDVKSYIESFNARGSRRAVTKGHIESFRLPLPPLPEQRAIAHILGTLDDKIELNQRMSRTLEALARALFKSWFVDFDPVRAKSAGHDPGLSKPLADLFPDSFEDSELGEIPKGWSVASLGDVCNVIDCLHSKKPERKDSGRPLLQLSNIRDNGLIDMADTYFIDEAVYDQWISRMEASEGDCVVTNVGRVGAVAQIPRGFKAALGRNMTGVRCKATFPFPTFIIENLLSDAMRVEMSLKTDSGTILDALNVRNIPRLRFTRASPQVLQRFEQLTRPLRARMEEGLAQSSTLADLRDTLLPKLISGELRVKNVEKMVGAVA